MKSLLLSAAFSALAFVASAQISFTNSNQSITGTSDYCAVAGNIDADLDIDVITGGSMGLIYVSKNNGTGTMTTTTLGTNGNHRGIDLADVDGDGFKDIVVAKLAGQSTIYLNDGTGSFTNSGDNFGSADGVCFGDINNDGDQDILIVNTSGQQNRILSNASAIFTNGHIFNTNSYTNCKLVDIDGDNDLDAILGGSTITDVYKNNGSGVFTYTVQTITAGRVNLADIDGDGDKDLITFATNTVIHKNNGTGIFTVFQTISGLPNNIYAYADIADLDGDGDNDLYIPTPNTGMDEIWVNNGAGTFTNSNATLQNTDGLDARLADFDGDGDEDVFIANITTANQLWFNNSTPCTPPTVGVTGTTSICVDNSTTLTANGASTYSWSTSATTAAITVSPTATTTYTVVGTAGIGCTATQTVTVIVNSLPTINITGTSPICRGSSTTLTASGGSTYSWNTSATTAAITVSPTTTTTYTVYGTSSQGCSNTQTMQVVVNTLPVVSLSGNNTICAGDSTLLTGSSGGTSQWYRNGVAISGATSNTYYASIAGLYNMIKTNLNGCFDSAAVGITVVVNALPVVSYTEIQTPICIYSAPVTLTAGTPANGTYSGLGVTGNSFNPSTAGAGTHNIIYTFTNGNGCTGSDTSQITVDLCTGVNQLQIAGLYLNVYPNPANTMVTLETNGLGKLTIVNALGEVVMQMQLTNNKTVIDLSILSDGVYHIQLLNNAASVSQKLVVKK